MKPTPSTPRRDGKVAITVGPGVTCFVPPDASGTRMDSADGPGEYRRDRDLSHVGILRARADAADPSPRTKRAVARINAHARRALESERAHLRARLDANERLIARTDAASTPAGRPRTGIEPGAFARRPVPALARSTVGASAPSSPTHRTAAAPSSPVAHVEPCTRLDVATDLSPAEKHAVRQIAASAAREDRDDAISAAIAIVRARRAAAPHRARPMSAADRIDADQVSSAAAKARRAMIERNVSASRVRE